MESSSNKRMKIFGVALATVALVVVGAVLLNNSNSSPVPLERAQALAKVENANVPLSEVPLESEVHVPQGWEVESDEPVGGPNSEEEEDESDHLDASAPEIDDDIDSPMDVEEDEDGNKYVAELDEDVIVDADEDTDEDLNVKETSLVAEDKKYVPRRCAHRLKKCGYRKVCIKRCKKRCKPYAVRKCRVKKYCKCFCKYYGKIKAARRCVIYKRKKCTTALTYRCRRGCKKFCRRAPRCYCCHRRHIMKKCRQLCRYISYKTKCGKCRCRVRKCIKRCRMVCRRYKIY